MQKVKKFWHTLETMSAERFSALFYRISSVGLLAFSAITAAVYASGNSYRNFIPNKPCAFLHATGLYCPGCGGTRAVLSLIEGDFLASIRFHPLVAYLAIGFLVFFFKHSVNHLAKRKVFDVKVRAVFFYFAIFIILLQFVVKNYFVIRYAQYIIGV